MGEQLEAGIPEKKNECLIVSKSSFQTGKQTENRSVSIRKETAEVFSPGRGCPDGGGFAVWGHFYGRFLPAAALV